jgi:hypothetical protein
MRNRNLSPLVVALILSLFLLPALAQASPPDPLWIGGVFDSDDSDDAVVAAASTDCLSDAAPLAAVEALWLVLGAVPHAASPSPARPVLSRFHGRAPPTV